MKKLTISILVTGLFAGSLFANQNNTIDLNKEKSIKVNKNLDKSSKNDEIKKETGDFFTDLDNIVYEYI